MPDEDMLGEIDAAVLMAADSLPGLLADLTAGQGVDPCKLAFARRAATTVATIAGSARGCGPTFIMVGTAVNTAVPASSLPGSGQNHSRALSSTLQRAGT